MSTDQKPRVSHPPLPDGRPETWICLADWPMPEDGKRAVERELAEYRFRGKELEHLQEGIKLSYLFGGLWVALRHTARGLTVVNVEDPSSDRLHPWRRSLPPKEAEAIVIHFIEDPYEERETRI
jgi:hypothetical protein